jgi:hypothetical protein
VHAVHFVAHGTGEIHLLERLKARIASARSMLDAPDPLSNAVCEPPTAHGRRLVILNMSGLAGIEVRRLQLARVCAVQGDELWLSELLASPWWILEARRRRLRVALSGRCILIYRVFSEDASGDIAAAQLVAISIPKDTLSSLKLSDAGGLIVERWKATAAALEHRFWQRRQARERILTRNAADLPGSFFQPALFDRRATRLHDEQRACADEQIVVMRERLADISRRSTIVNHASQLLLIVRT